jgi:DNA topoisomerase-1
MAAPNAKIANPLTDGEAAARNVGLRYVSDEAPGIRRKMTRSGFRYVDARGKTVRNPAVLKRIRSIVIPPAWTDVWISSEANGHIQATGRDARGRKQYRYHTEFRSVRDGAKFEHLLDFARVLPKIRRRVLGDLRKKALSREKVVATVIWLLDTTAMRVGNSDYARQNGSYGATTLRDKHARVTPSGVRFSFTGKSGKSWEVSVEDRRVARIVKACQDLPGQHLFQYLTEAGERRAITSTDVNAYLRETTGRDITAKDFRTWTGTVLAVATLDAFRCPESATEAKANVKEAIDVVSVKLGNTPAVCRKCYVHPAVIETHLASPTTSDSGLRPPRAPAGLSADEQTAWRVVAAARRPSRRRKRP